MGSYAHLHVGRLDLDWSKNGLNDDHAILFLSGDRATARYNYVNAKTGKPIVKKRPAFVCSLRDVLPRLELLGTTLDTLRHAYENRADEDFEELALPFDELIAFVGTMDLSADDLEEKYGNLQVPGVYGTMRLLACHTKHLDAPVIWRFADVVEGGWVDEESVYSPPATRKQFLIVTEGSTDALVLQRAFAMRRPRVADFFYFVDMKENYPFSGTGNLFNFSKGLARIRIENRVIVLYDNDAEGRSKLKASEALNLPRNIRVMHLPSLPSLESCATIGPTGEVNADLNGAAASIECYLDLAWREQQHALVRWTNYHEGTDRYQGALIGKERYIKRFLELRGAESDYNFEKLEAVLDAIIRMAVSMAEAEYLIGDAG